MPARRPQKGDDEYTDDAPEAVAPPIADDDDYSDSEEPAPRATPAKPKAAAKVSAKAPTEKKTAKASSAKAASKKGSKTERAPAPVADDSPTAPPASGRIAPPPTRGRDKLGSYYRSGRTGKRCYYTPKDYEARLHAIDEAIRYSGYD